VCCGGADDPARELVSRDFSDVRRVARAYRRLLDIRATGAFNICSGRARTLADILAMMVKVAGHEIAVQVDPALICAHELKRLCDDGRKLATAIGRPLPIPLRETLEWICRAR
jgi:nucleoside-diphosphate-sugar epimerase